jgi:hypothetical protein
MNPFYKLRNPALLLVAFLCGISFADAQNIVFSGAASASKVGVKDQFQVTYTVQDGGNLTTITQAFKDFIVVGGPFRTQSSSMQVVNGRTTQSSSQSITFILQARHAGNVTIPPAETTDQAGHTYKSNSIQIQIVPGSVAQQQHQRPTGGGFWDEDPFGSVDPFAAQRRQNPQPAAAAAPASTDVGKDIFIKVDVDRQQVKVGEQVTAVYKLYTRIPMQVAISKLPSLNGFWTQDFELPKKPEPTDEVVNGKHYQMFVLKKSALFPQQSGTLTLDVAEAQGTAQIATQVQRRSPFDDPFFKQAFSGFNLSDPFFTDQFVDVDYRQVPVNIKSAPVKITVSDLPEASRPADYTGAVGNFTVTASLDKQKLTTDDVATITLRIKGTGNLKLFDAPKLNLPNGLDSYEPNIVDTITGRTTTISGEKIISYSVAARKPGDYQIPPISLSYYDPASGSYKTASAEGFSLHVDAGNGYAATGGSLIGGARSNSDINDKLLLSAPNPMVSSPVYWSLYAMPLLLLLFVGVYRRREEEQQANSAQHRLKTANKVAQKRLSTAGQKLQQGDSRGFYDEVSKALWLYLSDKLGIPLSGLSKNAALNAIAQRGVPSPVQAQIEKVLTECELALYAPAGSGQQMQQTFSEAASIITGLERTLRA